MTIFPASNARPALNNQTQQINESSTQSMISTKAKNNKANTQIQTHTCTKTDRTTQLNKHLVQNER